jgi:hypothetical protein
VRYLINKKSGPRGLPEESGEEQGGSGRDKHAPWLVNEKEEALCVG